MKLNKKFIKFYEIENNNYYLLKYDDGLYLATESVLPRKPFLFWKRKGLTQGLKLLEITPPITLLFNSIIDLDVDKADEEFPDMTTYKALDNKELRMNIEKAYKQALDDIIDNATSEFEDWVDDFTLDNKDINQEQLDGIIEAQRRRLEQNISTIKSHNVINTINFKWNAGENLIVKKMLDNNMEFLYTQKIGAGYKIYYLYELDAYGTLTIYKVQCVKDIVKTIDTFIYNREIIQEMAACMVNNNL